MAQSLSPPPSLPATLSLPLSSPSRALPPPPPSLPVPLFSYRLYFSSFRLVLSRPVRQHRLWLARPTERLETRSSWKQGRRGWKNAGPKEYRNIARGYEVAVKVDETGRALSSEQISRVESRGFRYIFDNYSTNRMVRKED